MIVDHDQGLVESRLGRRELARDLLAAARERADAVGMRGWTASAISALDALSAGS